MKLSDLPRFDLTKQQPARGRKSPGSVSGRKKSDSIDAVLEKVKAMLEEENNGRH